MRKIVLSFFDHTTNMVKPWADSGYECHCIDINHPKEIIKNGNIITYGMDIFEWWPQNYMLSEEVKFITFFPPCTDVAVSGAAWFVEKGLTRLIGALKLFQKCIELTDYFDAPYMIENPVSTVSTYWRKPDYTFHPYEYGDPYMKKTCLWTGNGFKMPKRKPVYPTEGSKMHKMGPSKDRGYRRSITPMGFAKAVFEANHKG